MAKRLKHQSEFIFITERTPVWPTALKISALYLLFAIIWILFSDYIVFSFFKDVNLQGQISTIKGFIFVFLSALIIFFSIYPTLSKLSDKEQVIIENRNELKTLLYYDHLTELSNRFKLLDRLPTYLEDGTSKGKALLYIDVDDIKLINDTMGHATGDLLIVETAKRIASFMNPPDELYRLGGDELLLLTKFSQISSLKEKADALLNLFSTPFIIENTHIHSTISIGIALYPIHSTDPDELLKFADLAMFHAKHTGKNCSVLYNANMLASIHERRNLGEQLHTALIKNELEIYYQPQINTETRRLSGFEALLRWNNPLLGKVFPDKFIPVAEETQLIIPFGEWVIRRACMFIHSLHLKGFSNLSISVNVSMIQLLQNNFAQSVLDIIHETEVKPNCLEIEITESILMETHQFVLQQLSILHEKGIRIALDDFGKGYSSLSYLARLPISTLKIDKVFIDTIDEAENDTSLAGDIIRIGKKLGLNVVAEGVETEVQFSYLANQKCDFIQGWIFSKALREKDAELFALTNTKSTVRVD